VNHIWCVPDGPARARQHRDRRGGQRLFTLAVETLGASVELRVGLSPRRRRRGLGADR